MARRIQVEILGNSADVERAFARASRSAQGFNASIGRAGRGAIAASVGFRGLGRSIAFASGAFLGGAGIVTVLKQSSSAASNLGEQLSKSGVLFGKSADEIEAWSQTAATSLGLASDQAVQAAAAFGGLLRPLGFTQEAAAQTSEQLTQLGADLASFSNTSVPDALQAIQSGLVGEIEPLRRYGVVLSEAAVQQVALQQTGKESAKQLTAQEKVSARLAIIFKQTSLAQGDFARTSGGLANQQRILLANLRQLEITLGQALNPEILKVVSGLNKWLGNTENQRRVQKELSSAVRDGVQIISGFARGLDAVRRITSPLVNVIGGLTKAVELLIIAMAVRKVLAFTAALRTVAPAAIAAETALGAQGVAAGGAATKMGKLGSLTRALGSANVVAIAATVTLTKALDDQASSASKAEENLRMLWDQWLRGQRLAPGIGKIEDIRRGRKGGFGERDLNLPLPTGTFHIPSRAPTLSEQLALAAAAAGLTGSSEDDVRALTAQRAQLQKALAFAQRQIDLHRGNTAEFVAHVKEISGQIESINSQLAAIAEARAQSAKDAADRAKAARQKELEHLKSLFKNAPATVRLGLPNILAAARGAIRELNRREAARLQAREFRALGLTSTGDELAPSRRALVREVNRLDTAIQGTFLDNKKTGTVIAGIRKALKLGLDGMSRDVRLTIKRIIDDLSGQIGDRGPLTKAAQASSAQIARDLTRGLGLRGDALKQLRHNIVTANLVTANPQTAPITTGGKLHIESRVHVGIDGREVALATVTHASKAKRRSVTQTSGRNAGSPNRFG